MPIDSLSSFLIQQVMWETTNIYITRNIQWMWNSIIRSYLYIPFLDWLFAMGSRCNESQKSGMCIILLRQSLSFFISMTIINTWTMVQCMCLMQQPLHSLTNGDCWVTISTLVLLLVIHDHVSRINHNRYPTNAMHLDVTALWWLCNVLCSSLPSNGVLWAVTCRIISSTPITLSQITGRKRIIHLFFR